MSMQFLESVARSVFMLRGRPPFWASWCSCFAGLSDEFPQRHAAGCGWSF